MENPGLFYLVRQMNMFRYFLLPVFLIVAVQMNAQVTELSIRYNVGHDCEQKANNEDGYINGACWHEETLEYTRQGHAFRANRISTLSLFFEWNGGFQPNSIRDSIFIRHLFSRRKLPATELEDYLSTIVGLCTDSILHFNPADFSDDRAFIALCRDSAEVVARYVNPDPEERIYSTVMPWFRVKFTMNSTEFTLWQDAYNHFWELKYMIDGSEQSFHFIHSQFDAFLAGNLPKRFSGTKIVSNRGLETDLKERLGLPDK